VDHVYEQFGLTGEGKTALRLKQGRFVKEFMEEIWPLALFADAFYAGRTEFFFEPTIGNQSYDVRIYEGSVTREGLRGYLQITQALNGYQNHLRMLHLTQYGRAPRTGDLQKGRGSQELEESWGEAVPHNSALEATFQEIKAAVLNKSTMRYEAHTELVVEFDDWCIRSAADKQAFDEWARRELVRAASHFSGLYLVSDRDRLAFHYLPEVASLA